MSLPGHRRRPPRRAGFTLLEMTLAVGLTVLLMGGVYAFYRLTLGVRADVRQQGEEVFAQRRALELLAGELQSAVVYPFLMMGLSGDGEQVTFMRTAVPSRAVFYADKLLDARSAGPAYEPEHDIQMIGYRLNRYEDEDGVEQIGGLERTALRTIQAQVVSEQADRAEPAQPTGRRASSPPADETGEPSEPGSAIHVTLLTQHVKFLRLSYWDGAAWVDQWDQRDLPSAVMIEMGAQPLPEDLLPEEYPYPTISRVVAIPGGYRPVEGTIVREGAPTDAGGGSRGGGR